MYIDKGHSAPRTYIHTSDLSVYGQRGRYELLYLDFDPVPSTYVRRSGAYMSI